MQQRAYYSNNTEKFCTESPNEIIGKIVYNSGFDVEQKQRNAWLYEIKLLQEALSDSSYEDIALEYTIPRIGKRIDVVLHSKGVIYLIEFKGFGEDTYSKPNIDQVTDYALDLKYFHEKSYDRKIVPILLCPNAPNNENEISFDEDGIYRVIKTNEKTIRVTLEWLSKNIVGETLSFDAWLNSRYTPTPTIIEAAQALYRGHNVGEISRTNDDDAYNLGATSDAIINIIHESKVNNRKSICFVTGVPGAGKTLAGLNIANAHHNFEEDEHAVFLSGNGPLVNVLREALARDKHDRTGIKKEQAKRETNAFIQNIHHFRDESIKNNMAPIEKVIIFDEAQRAWTVEKTAKFMAKRGDHNWNMSEPEFLISVVDRHQDWATIVCLVGGGQEINTGEAGLPEWFTALKNRFSHWDVYVSQQISEEEYTREDSFEEMKKGLNVIIVDKLHLAVSLRSFRSERVAAFIKSLLDMDVANAQRLLSKIQRKYKICMTRNLEKACKWVCLRARGTERYGLIASAGGKRLRSVGIWVQSEINVENWFLNDKDDVQSSYYLEDTATEFDIQGLEIDWAIVAWDANYRIENGVFVPYKFKGKSWHSVKNNDEKLYLKNAYRVLLTRARQGIVIFIPEGDDEDHTRPKEYYDPIYHYLKTIGIKEIK